MTTTLTALAGVRSSNRLGRFAPMLDQVADPLGYEAGDANLRRYVGNSPTRLTDPSGLSPVDDVLVIPAADLLKPVPILVGKVTSADGKVHGDFAVYVLRNENGRLIGVQFDFKPTAGNEYGWIQHFQDVPGGAWRYDNERKTVSDPSLKVQPVKRKYDGHPSLTSQLDCWNANPWYGGPAGESGRPNPSHSWGDVEIAFKGPGGKCSDAIRDQLKKLGIDPDAPPENFWKSGVLKYFEVNPFPQLSLFDAPEGSKYITQLVISGDSFGNGPGAGTVLLAISWTPPAEIDDGKDAGHFKLITPGAM
jgi:hypothetical protein